jgi:hypothetical protein
VLDVIADAAKRRLALEREQGVGLVAKSPDAAAAAATEQRVRAAWIKWYGEAFDTVERLPVGASTDALRAKIATAKSTLAAEPPR